MKAVRRKWWFALVGLLWMPSAFAVVTINIRHAYGQQFPIAIVPFKGESALPPADRPGAIVRRDLEGSGWFQIVPVKDYLALPHSAAQVEFNDWRLLKVTALVIGRVQAIGNGEYKVAFRLYAVDKGEQLAGLQYQVQASQLRMVGHTIANAIFKALTGVRGIFTTRIAFVTMYPRGLPGHYLYELKIADAEGHGMHVILRSTHPIMGPNWSPHGRRIAYVSFETGWPAIYVQDVATGARRMVAAFHGLNSAPAFAPDGTHLAMCLSKSGYPEIYVMNLTTGHLRQLTFGPDINTEPHWSPGGNHLVFTSNRSGHPQIYEMNAHGGDKRRLTFDGRYNADASFSPDGKWLTLVSRQNGQYHAALLQLADSTLETLTQTSLDESPTFAPNGQEVLYSTVEGGHRALVTVSVNGRGRRVLGLRGGDISGPAWSPFHHQ
ncbi:MAG: Tol-Pal system beta propeller repeat protein TolB [Gammaproteobacteria bacterium]|nr:Tol-Pal system beta propeller repeat protein TolB [Gammaproteobacteria bacterium]